MEQHLTQYRIFYAVARAGNISRAAKELFISQPAISKSISKLEESLGMALFIRNSRGVSLTAEGQVLFQHVEAAFEALERGENELKQIQNLHIGQLKIGVSNTLCKYILLPYLKGFIAQYPHVRILIESQDTARTAETRHRSDRRAEKPPQPFISPSHANRGHLCLYPVVSGKSADPRRCRCRSVRIRDNPAARPQQYDAHAH